MIVTNPWVSIAPRSGARLRLLCFPHSGAGALAFRTWQSGFPAEIDVCPVQLPGRENRFRSAPYTSMPSLIDAIVDALAPYLDQPFALYGQSLGALVAFEVARKLRSFQAHQPVHLLVASCRAPQQPPSDPPIYQLPDAAFLAEVERFDGLPKQILQNQEAVALVLPALRADLAIYDTYTYVAASALECPITAYGGLQDTRASQEAMAPWQTQTGAKFSLQLFPGSHFFWQTAQNQFLPVLARELLTYL